MDAPLEYPKKLYYSISEVADITGVKAHVLRYWETEFPSLHPKKTRAGSRRYRQPDIESVLAIKDLLYVKGFKIAGARKALREEKAADAAPAQPAQMAMGFESMSAESQLAFVRTELQAILDLVQKLGQPKAAPLKKMAGKG